MNVEIEPPHVGHRRHADRHWADFAIPGAALLVSLTSIAIALHHGKVMESLVQQNERLVQANSLPYVQLAYSSATEDGKPGASMLAINSGVGPAEIRSVSVTVNGQPVANLKALLDRCCGGKGDAKIATSTLLNRMLQAGEASRYVMAFGPNAETPVAKALIRANVAEQIVTTICYCSVFGECWVNASSGMTRPRSVKVCPMPAVQYRS